ncbi:AAA family ATPase [Dolichospermum sp. ST_con]|nr:AAA family ATPase [Dolichospermum sp. ST_con]MDD1417678.1 AAA family ATPase [Dolichospermum sp. ST_sed1]MDD1424166.1 AAA family ATPase [Dolichospermum sp. ST_sed9]MDD1430819.1 AAA family ATPase [Dolichospermum sp. ST_sed6]MDD1435510.1 AAA family ATPase [Dolichospermum sp. ST_sed10]MDD1438917.1 AAA family ATPase [Dolichospermum sp. ST_sed3]MDD1445173.1 AAA family ATPase [Dolichospermum sp. ST_sed8]MDD1453594.1 AAA family ATPase [Dolichospermum sp. ST_sed7]MDD1459252.1 AAA family ATPase [D
MHLQRIQVPDFRALKDVDISFEKEFTPRIFPLGSQNGGGKSTLLQLIFVLLHCSGNPDRVEFIQNLLDGFQVNNESGKRTLTIIDIWDSSKTVTLDFFICSESYILNLLDGEYIEDYIVYLFNEDGEIKSTILHKETSEKYIDLLFICNFQAAQNFREGLFCQFDRRYIDEVNKFVIELSNKIFLAAHISQIFLFLQPDNRKSLFKQQENNQTNYYQQIKAANSKLPGFFTYDFLSIDILIASFKKAQEDDFAHAVKQRGNYGNNYVKLLDELDNLLTNKKINVEPDLSGINFKIDGDETELYPEDLSHGELKRLCIYMWLKHNNIEDAIVLMDELEISFHPDWQYQIVRDLEEWGASNQYILATHSYELCNAVTPAHVKELDPKLQARTIQ